MPMAAPQDRGEASVVVSESAIQRFARKRKQAEAAANFPNAALAAVSESQSQCIIFYCDMICVLGYTWSILTTVIIAHKHKGKGKPFEQAQAYRPLGSADPLLHLVADLFQLRTRFVLSLYSGTEQLGGIADPKYHVRDARTAREALSLPLSQGRRGRKVWPRRWPPRTDLSPGPRGRGPPARVDAPP